MILTAAHALAYRESETPGAWPRHSTLMRRIRLRLFALALVAVIGQMVATAATTAVLYGTSTSTVAGDEGTACTCPHGGMRDCPMHGSQASERSSQSSSRGYRWCAGGSDHAAVVLTTLTFPGPVVRSFAAVVPTPGSEWLIGQFAPASDVVLPLLSPPPRA